jgi:hypothetical protein
MLCFAKRLSVVALVVAASLNGYPLGARAALSLTGEFLSGTLNLQALAQSTCDPQGTSTTVIDTSGSFIGVATGPYPGTFTEGGTVTIGPQNIPGAPNTGLVQTADFQFTIISGATVITGTKHLAPVHSNSTGQCVSLQNEPVSQGICESYRLLGQWDGNGSTSVTFHRGQAELTYQATIQEPSGASSDSGAAIAGWLDARGSCGGLNFAAGQLFNEQFLVSNGVVPLTPATVTLSPATAINTIGGTHTVTATALNVLLQPVASATVLFSVQGSVTVTGSCTTGSDGQCSFTYQGPQLPGADLIRGCADNNGNGVADPTEPCGDATKIWMLPASTPGQVTGGGWITKIGAARVSFGFNAQSDGQPVKGNCNVIDHATQTHIKCLTVDTLVVAATHATFFGQASVGGATTTYRIDVDDLSEPGTQDTFKIQTDGGYIAVGILEGGNIQIHH